MGYNCPTNFGEKYETHGCWAQARLYRSFPLLCKSGCYSAFEVTGVKQNLFYNFLLSISQILVPLISIPYVSRILDPEGIGRVGFVDGFTYYFVVLAEAGIMVYGIREVARCRQDKQALGQLVNELLSLHIRSSLISLILYAGAVWFLWSKVGDIRLLYFSVAFLLVNAFACEWYFIGQERFRYIALRSILIRLGGADGFIVAAKGGGGLLCLLRHHCRVGHDHRDMECRFTVSGAPLSME